MASNHRGQEVGDNHRPTPRIAQAYAKMWLDYRDTDSPEHKEAQVSEAQDLINSYRNQRDTNHPDLGFNKPDVKKAVKATRWSPKTWDEFNSFIPEF